MLRILRRRGPIRGELQGRSAVVSHMEGMVMTQGMSLLLLLLMSLNLSPQGARELGPGTFWSYKAEGGNLTIRITEVSPAETGLSLTAEVLAGEALIPLRVVLGPGRRSVSVSVDTPSGERRFEIAVPELKPGSRLELPEQGAAIIERVEPAAVTVSAGSFLDAVKVSLSVEGKSERPTLWLAPGVGVVAVGSGEGKQVQLVDYGPRERPAPIPGAQIGPREGPPATVSVMPGPPGQMPGPALTALDENTFVVADPVTRTVTVFAVTRDSGQWRLVATATAPYGLAAPR